MIKKQNKGFTLIELLVVIGILAILLSITLIAINPARQFGNANDTKRRSAVTQILNALGAYQAENGGVLPAVVLSLTPAVAKDISNVGTPLLCDLLVPDYIPAFPRDPAQTGGDIEKADCAPPTPGGIEPAWATGYTITKDINNRLTISATGENTPVISVSR
ncbi:MAG: type II secretion system protein [Patescibacteria group bacterium]